VLLKAILKCLTPKHGVAVGRYLWGSDVNKDLNVKAMDRTKD